MGLHDLQVGGEHVPAIGELVGLYDNVSHKAWRTDLNASRLATLNVLLGVASTILAALAAFSVAADTWGP
jgi:hypothetical protein